MWSEQWLKLLEGGGGLKCILLTPNFALESVAVKTQDMLSLHGGCLIYAMYHHREAKFFFSRPDPN